MLFQISKKVMENSTKIIYASLITYVISLTQPCFSAFETVNGYLQYTGWQLVLAGAFAFLGGGGYETFVWLANVFYALTLIFYFKRIQEDKVFTFSLIAVLISISFYFCKSVLAAENGRQAVIIGKHLGYYVWVLSILISFIGIILRMIK